MSGYRIKSASLPVVSTISNNDKPMGLHGQILDLTVANVGNGKVAAE
jgi:hypothetical protein